MATQDKYIPEYWNAQLFEHEIFTALSVFMRNLTDHWTDYKYSFPDHLLNTTTHYDHETEPEDSPESSSSRTLLTTLTLFLSLYMVNKTVLKSRLISYATQLITCYAIITPALPFMGLFFGVIGLSRLAIYVYFRLFRRNCYLLSPEDGFWAYEQYASSSASVALYVIEGKCDKTKIQSKVSQVVQHPVVNGRMTRRLTQFLGYAIWEDVQSTTYNVSNHVTIARRPKPWTYDSVLSHMTTFQDTPFRPTHPAWEVIIFPNLLMEGSDKPAYACIFRMHHAIMDGISSANILHDALGDKPFKFTVDPVNPSKRASKLTTALMYFLALVLLPRNGIINGFFSLDNKFNKFFLPGETLRGPKHFAWSKPVSMEALKKIKDDTKTSVMTVLLATLGGSYRAVKKSNLPDFYHALAPVALLPYPDRHPRNGFSGVALPVAVGKFNTARDRLQANHKAFQNLRIGMMEILGNMILIDMVGVMPTVLQRIFGGGVHFKMSLSNIPGSSESVQIFGGDTIVEMGAWLPCKFSLGMAMGLFSYGTRCRATFVGDSTYFSKSEVQELTSTFENELLQIGTSLGMSKNDIFCN